MNDKPNGPTVVDLPKRDDMRAALDNMRRVMPAMLEHVELQSRIRRAAFLALVTEGFTEAQALELCWRA